MRNALNTLRQVERMSTHYLPPRGTKLAALDSDEFAQDLALYYTELRRMHHCSNAPVEGEDTGLFSVLPAVARPYTTVCYGIGTTIIDFAMHFATNSIRGRASQLDTRRSATCSWFRPARVLNGRRCHGLLGCYLPQLSRTSQQQRLVGRAWSDSQAWRSVDRSSNGSSATAPGRCARHVSLSLQHPAAAAWLRDATVVRGYCGVTSYGGRCYRGASGAWNLDTIDACIAACRGCERCRFI